jgi:hypothetical protein
MAGEGPRILPATPKTTAPRSSIRDKNGILDHDSHVGSGNYPRFEVGPLGQQIVGKVEIEPVK